MRQPRIQELFLSAVLAFLPGCIPATFTRVPEIRGRVVDAAGQAMPGASVHLTRLPRYGGYNLDETLNSDTAGRFHRKEQAVWAVFIVGEDNFGSRFQAVASFNGEQSAPREFGMAWSKVRLMGLGAADVADLGDLKIDQAATRP
jgi:hypothetical protein